MMVQPIILVLNILCGKYPSGKMKNRFTFKGYRSGHMMYLRNEDLIKANDDLRDFISKTLTKGKPAKY